MNVTELTTELWARGLSLATVTRHQVGQRFQSDERGEGVISAAIAVLIMAAVGALAWTAFQALFNSANDKASAKVGAIG